jgi:hypothetical protein
MVISSTTEPMIEASAKATVLIDLVGHLGQRARGLHLLLRDAAGEIVVEEGHRLAQRPAVEPRLHQHVDIGLHDDVLAADEAPKASGRSTTKKAANPSSSSQFSAKKPAGPVAERGVDHRAQDQRRQHLHHAGQRRDRRRRQQHRPGAREAPVDEGATASRRRPRRGWNGSIRSASFTRRPPLRVDADEAARLARPEAGVEPASRSSRSACVPSSTTRPSSSTTIRSIRAMVESRCAMAITVLPSITP